jgi:uncharacterized lipoprotein YddW (UPF0748 family)
MILRSRPGRLAAIIPFVVALCQPPSQAQDLLAPGPKREARAAWIATVTNLDWPNSPGADPAVQRNQLVAQLDLLKSSGVNTAIFQIRTECDALYQSAIDPWSYWLTGAQGTPPNPVWDPLAFAIDEAHKRGMELHAWFNPYRVDRAVGTSYPKAPTHVSVTRPEWCITIGTFKFLDPGEPPVRAYVAGVVTDVVRRYDIDGIHFDDYFYPYPPNEITNQDDSTFAQYPRGFANRGDWRRDNVNLLIRMVNDSLRAVKPWVKFGMSPFGIWKNGVPPGIVGLDAYSTIYCDAMAWLQAGTIDYLTPQLYWRIGGSQDYSRLQPWWSDSTAFYGRHFYPGHILNASYTTAELPAQLRLDRGNPKVQGGVWFRSGLLQSNALNFNDSLRLDYYRYPAVNPVMAWKDTVKPNAVRNLRFAQLPGNGQAAVQWDLPLPAADGDTANRYILYRFLAPPSLPGDLDQPANILDVTGRRSAVPPVLTGSYPAVYFVVTAFDRNTNESAASTLLSVPPAPAPLLAAPANGAANQPPGVTVRWRREPLASLYHLQVSTDPAFTGGFLVNDSSVVDTAVALASANGQTLYHWRVRSRNPAGSGAFTAAWTFTTGFPSLPSLAYPANNTVDLPPTVAFRWNRAAGAQTYRFQLSLVPDFSTLVRDIAGLTDTILTAGPLQSFTIYYWRVNASNTTGTTPWPAANRFRVILYNDVAVLEGLPTSYTLEQNYPNPFNPATTIRFAVPEAGRVTLRVYDVLGREVAALVDDAFAPGLYSVQWSAPAMPSGVYFYRIASGSFSETKRMVLVK